MKPVWREHPLLYLSELHIQSSFIFHFIILLIILKLFPVAAFLVRGRYLLVLGRWVGTASPSGVSPWCGWHCLVPGSPWCSPWSRDMDKGDQGLCFDPWWIRTHLGGFSRCWAIQAALFAFWVVFFVWIKVAMPSPPGCWPLAQRAH